MIWLQLTEQTGQVLLVNIDILLALCGAVTSDDRLGLFRPTKDGADKPSRFAQLGRVFARLVVAVRLAFRRPATSAMHATHGPATNGG